jgi:hypothetical protein
VEELLTSYNFALETVILRPCGDRALLLRVNELLEHNTRVRALGTPRYHHQLDQFYEFPSRAAWPRVLEGWSRFPTLLYRFVRQANMEAFANQVQPAAANHVQPVVMAAAADAQNAGNQVQLVVAEEAPAAQRAATQVPVPPEAATHVQPVVVVAAEAETAEAQHGTNRVQWVVAKTPPAVEALHTAQLNANEVLPVAESQPAVQGANKKRRHPLISE